MDDETELSFMIAEYEAQNARVQASIGAISQHVSLFVGAVTLLATAATGVSALLWPDQRSAAFLVAAGASLSTSIGGTLTLFATFRARLQQTESEQSLSRLRHYFLTTWPHLKPFVRGSVNDDWRTPYSHPRSSNTVLAWLVLITFTSGSFGLALSLAAVAASTISPLLVVLLGSAGVLGAFSSFAAWLGLRLKQRRIAYKPLFPKETDSGSPP